MRFGSTSKPSLPTSAPLMTDQPFGTMTVINAGGEPYTPYDLRRSLPGSDTPSAALGTGVGVGVGVAMTGGAPPTPPEVSLLK